MCIASGADNDASRWWRFLGAFVGEVEIAPADQEAVGESIHRAHRAENLWRFVPEGTHATLDALRDEGFCLGVVSNADGRVASLLTDLDLHHRFDVIVDSFHVGFEKPSPEIFHIALAALEANPEEALYVGDLYSVDVLGARAAGMDAALLDPLGLARNPDCAVLRTIGDVRGLVNAAARSGGRGSLPRT
jgi:putative hydrolase of the HAD superfamily